MAFYNCIGTVSFLTAVLLLSRMAKLFGVFA